MLACCVISYLTRLIVSQLQLHNIIKTYLIPGGDQYIDPQGPLFPLVRIHSHTVLTLQDRSTYTAHSGTLHTHLLHLLSDLMVPVLQKIEAKKKNGAIAALHQAALKTLDNEFFNSFLQSEEVACHGVCWCDVC